MKIMDQNKIKRGTRVLVKTCGNVRRGDRVLILADRLTKKVGERIYDIAVDMADTKLLYLPLAKMHGEEPPRLIAAEMSKATVIFCVTTFSLAHTKARKNATDRGARFLSLPDYSLNLLGRPSLNIDFVKNAKTAQIIKKIFDSSEKITVTTQAGTNIDMVTKKRKGNYCPGFCFLPGSLGSPPDVETNIPPIEEKSNGIIVVDGSVPCKEIGLIKDKIIIEVKRGVISNIAPRAGQAKIIKKIFSQDPARKVLAEFGIGLNPKARLCGIMLEDEGCLGTVHFGFGSNSSIGGKNKVNFHLDCVIRKPSVLVDDTLILSNGRIVV